MSEIPTGDSVTQSEDKVAKVAVDTLEKSTPPEGEPFNISFNNYKEEKCCIKGMEGWNAQAAIKIIKDIGIKFNGSGFTYTVKSISNGRPYEDFYRGIPDEIIDGQEVKEIVYEKYKKPNQIFLRIFFYTLRNVFFLLAISTVHENLDHREPEYKK